MVEFDPWLHPSGELTRQSFVRARGPELNERKTMIIPKSFHPIVQLLEDAADGANQYAAVIGLKQNTEPVIRGTMAALVGVPAGPDNVPPAVPGLMALWNAAKSNKCAKTAALRSAISNKSEHDRHGANSNRRMPAVRRRAAGGALSCRCRTANFKNNSTRVDEAARVFGLPAKV